MFFEEAMRHRVTLSRIAARLAAIVILLAVLAAAEPQLVDCVAAEIDNQAITLTDIRIIQAFDLWGEAAAGAPTPMEILQRTIDRRVVVGLMRQSLPIAREDVEARLQSLRARFAPAEWQRRLEKFGITEGDLRSYVEDNLQYERMISIRFGPRADISVKEIQDYYDNDYVPAQKAAGQEPKPMVQVLNEIEARLRDQKRESQVSAWIRDLRSQAEIRIHAGCLEQLR
jgi:hypothetical protein